MLAVALALGAAVSWGVADFLGGLTTRGIAVLGVLLVSQGAGFVIAAAAVALGTTSAPTGRYLVYGALAGVALAVGLGALYQGLAVGAMGVVSPIAATGAVVPVTAALVRGERPSALQAAGVALAMVGVVLVSRQPGVTELGTRLSVGVWLALLAAGGIGFFLLAVDAAAPGGVLWAMLMQRLGIVTVVAAAVVALRPPLGLGTKHLPALLGIGMLDLTATSLFAAATTQGLTSLVSVVASLYPVTTIALAYVLLGERLAVSQRAGAVGALAGVGLISAG